LSITLKKGIENKINWEYNHKYQLGIYSQFIINPQIMETIMNKNLVIISSSCLCLLLSACNSSRHNSAESDMQSEQALPKQVLSAAQPVSYSVQTQRLQKHKRVFISPALSVNSEKYQAYNDNPVHLVSEQSLSTFSIDVDTASYSNIRRMLLQGDLPPKDAVKTEELINYFTYDYPVPEDKQRPFSITTEISETPWNKHSKLLHIGIKGYDIEKTELPPANLVFLVDVSGSMRSPNKLELLKKSLKLLVKQLSEKDTISLVVYAGAAGVVLEPTPANQRLKIEQALEQLTAGGSTNGEAGIKSAYTLARQAFIEGGINRIIIASDGDMNVGISDTERLKELIAQKRKTGISLTTLGFGSGNYNYDLMEQLADTGNGTAAYIDNLLEAQKVLVNEMSSTLLTIAKDVKIQIEFSPNVKEYRLIGYENRLLEHEDFNNDKVDAGDIGAGHTVTALYELVLSGEPGMIDPLRYKETKKTANNNELAFLKIRYKDPDQANSQLISKAILMDEIKDADNTSKRFRFSASVAAYGQLLRGGKYLAQYDYKDIIALAQSAKGKDEHGYRANYIELLRLAQNLSEINR